MRLLKAYSQLTKTGIILFALVSALAGYAMSFQMHQAFDPMQPVLLVVGLYLAAGAGFAFNQAQEWRIDARMQRTRGRPIPSGLIRPWQAYALGTLMAIPGLLLLFVLGAWPAGLTLLTLFLYNVVYTLFWKRRWVFGAVPGAIPGAMPVVLGYSVNTAEIWRPECVYLFLVMFLWQMPHFWSLAIRFREDYQRGGFPVLPVSLGVPRALYHVGLYVFTYVGVALMAPWFLQAHVLYFFLVVPISLKVLIEFYKYYRSQGTSSWLPFFLWTNFSLLIYLAVPVMDKWIAWATNGNFYG
mgnify:CR=1 FL=1